MSGKFRLIGKQEISGMTYIKCERQELAVDLSHVGITWGDETFSQTPSDEVLRLRVQLVGSQTIRRPDNAGERTKLCSFTTSQWPDRVVGNWLQVRNVKHVVAQYPKLAAPPAPWFPFVALQKPIRITLRAQPPFQSEKTTHLEFSKLAVSASIS